MIITGVMRCCDEWSAFDFEKFVCQGRCPGIGSRADGYSGDKVRIQSIFNSIEAKADLEEQVHEPTLTNVDID